MALCFILAYLLSKFYRKQHIERLQNTLLYTQRKKLSTPDILKHNKLH